MKRLEGRCAVIASVAAVVGPGQAVGWLGETTRVVKADVRHRVAGTRHVSSSSL